MLIKLIVHIRRNPLPWAVYTSPFFFLVAATICTLSIVYKGSPSLGLNSKPPWYVAAVVVGTGFGVCLLAAIFFVPFLYARILKMDYTVKWYHVFLGPALFKRTPPADAHTINVPDYAVVQHDDDMDKSGARSTGSISDEEVKQEKEVARNERELTQTEVTESSSTNQKTYKERVAEGQERFHAKLRKKRGPLGWAMRTLHDNPMGAGQIYEFKNMRIAVKRIPAMVVVAALYGIHYDIHAAQTGIAGTPDGERMARVYAAAEKYPNEVEHTYSFIQILTACTASFAHGANDIGNSVGPWAVIYGAWSTGSAAQAKQPVPIWQLAVLALTISLGLITYGYNIMKGALKPPLTFHPLNPYREENIY